MPKPTMPTLPPPALRSNPDTFSANAEGTLTALPVVTEYMSDAMDFTSEEADRATAAAALATGGSGLDLTGQGGKFLRVNDDETGTEFFDFPAVGSEFLEATTVDQQLAALGLDGMIGAIVAFPMNSAPPGFLKCNFAAYSRTAYSRLFAKIGTTYGAGDGSTTFNVPEARGEFIRGWDDGRGADPGRVFGSAQGSENKWHSHTGTTNTDGAHSHPVTKTETSGSNDPRFANGDFLSGEIYTTIGGGAHSHSFTTGGTGGDESRPRNIALLYCIKY